MSRARGTQHTKLNHEFAHRSIADALIFALCANQICCCVKNSKVAAYFRSERAECAPRSSYKGILEDTVHHFAEVILWERFAIVLKPDVIRLPSLFRPIVLARVLRTFAASACIMPFALFVDLVPELLDALTADDDVVGPTPAWLSLSLPMFSAAADVVDVLKPILEVSTVDVAVAELPEASVFCLAFAAVLALVALTLKRTQSSCAPLWATGIRTDW